MRTFVLTLTVGVLCLPLVAAAQDATTPDPSPGPCYYFWFSTEMDFVAQQGGGAERLVSDGDLLSEIHCLLLTNHQLTRNLGIMPPAPDLGLDAVTVSPISPTVRPEVLFSLETSVWSETLGRISDGDLLSIRGLIVRTNYQLIDAFEPGPIPLPGVGLDAIHPGPFTSPVDTGYLFSTEIGFYSRRLECDISDGDLLSEAGFVYRTHRELMRNFHPINEEGDPIEAQFGLDAVYVASDDTIWFSVEHGFRDRELGWVGDGDVLSEDGRILRTNWQLIDVCDPITPARDIGCDALHYYRCSDPLPEPVDVTPVEP